MEKEHWVLVKNSHNPLLLAVNLHEKKHLCLSFVEIQALVTKLMTGCGTQCWGLVDMELFGQQPDLMVFEVFSNLIDFVKFVAVHWSDR